MSALVVEAETPIRQLVRDQLEAQGMPVHDAGTVAAALELLRRRSFTVVILDLTLPDGSGLEVLDSLRRAGSESHVIVLSSATSEADRLDALRRGADDYVVKPFFARELTARVLAVRRRRDPKKDALLKVGPVTINLRARVVMKDNAPLELASKEFDLLAYLAARPGHVFTRDELLQAVWHSSSDWQQDATVTEHIRRLRAKVERDPGHPELLVTVRGAGYRLEGAAAGPPPDAEVATPLTSSVRSGTVIVTGDVIVFADQVAAELLGFRRPADMVGKSAMSLVAKKSMDAVHSRMGRIESASFVRSQSLAVRHADGSEPLLDLASDATEWNGQPARRIVISPAADPSARLLHMAVGVFSELTDAVIVTDLNFHLRSWNRAAERLYGWQQHEVLGRHVLDILPWTGGDGALGRAWQSLETKGWWKGTGRHFARDGSIVDVFVSLSLLRNDADERIGIACIHRQIVDATPADTGSEQDLPDGSDIRRGIAAGEFDVFYQPVVRLEDRTVVGVEALLRWNHPQLGLLSPASFLPAAESSELIVELGNFALGQACQQTAKWVRQGFDLEVSVNLSVRQLVDPLVVDRVAAALESAGLEPDRLWLEVTETTLVEDVGKAAEVLHLLVLHGARIAIDDFGTGWASLTYLRTFPVHALKIDRSFVAGIDSSASDAAIARSILSLAAELHLDVVAEGIETAEQAQALQNMGCLTGQGYLYGAATRSADVPLDRACGVRSKTPTARGLVGRTASAEHGAIAHQRAASDAVTTLLRGLLHIRSARAAVELLHLTIGRLGATLVPATDAGPDALPLDVSLGEGPPLLPVVEPTSVTRLQLERVLPMLVEDARHAIDLLRQRERLEVASPAENERLRPHV